MSSAPPLAWRVQSLAWREVTIIRSAVPLPAVCSREGYSANKSLLLLQPTEAEELYLAIFDFENPNLFTKCVETNSTPCHEEYPPAVCSAAVLQSAMQICCTRHYAKTEFYFIPA